MRKDWSVIVKPGDGYVQVKEVDHVSLPDYLAKGWVAPTDEGYVETRRGLTPNEIGLLVFLAVGGALITFAAGPEVIQWVVRRLGAWSSTLGGLF